MLRLPETHRDLFKRPFGTLYRKIGDLLPRLEGRAVYAVGDVVTHNLLGAGIVPDIAIIDGYTMRSPCTRSPLLQTRRLTAKNPAGTIADELVEVIDKAVRDPPVVIFVDGEEDLAVIPLVLAAPAGAAILYGQPGEGVVLRLVDDAAKREAASMLEVFVRE
ncbi:GTP-dependent dephospho-CoA kinase family protein [Methanoculleus sp.]|uniref:GTP-dependent dephospho-CoA kinase family protein n=1 Tax=Methanoculleus sp. TaxID=90427 RepID=UPI0025CB9D64|nr:GTP-dependent dephospho-CoA kinase family protein [Methanoculleus sp.]